MADIEWGGRWFMERAFDSLRPTRLQKVFQRPEARRQPSEASEQPSKPPEHQAPRRTSQRSATSQRSGSKVSKESVDKTPPKESRGLVGRDFSSAMLENTIDPSLSKDPAPETYIAGPENGEPPYTGGPSRIILTSDGTQGCLALLLARDMVTSMNQVLLGSSKVDELQKKIDALDTEITFAEISLRQYAEDLPELPGKADEEAKLRTMMEETRERSRDAASSKEMLEETLFREKLELAFSRDEIQEDFQRVLSESRLLEVDEQSAEMEQRRTNPSGMQEPQSPGSSIKSVETVISTDELNRRVTYEEVETSRQRYHSLRIEFENREAFYECEFREYQEAIEDGSCVLPQSEFDRIFVRNISRLTRALINAEAAYENALTRARALRIVGNDFEQESDFVDQEDDGYRESFEADMAAGADRLFIHQWMEVTEESGNQEDDALIDESDDWGARPVEISDSISMVAEGRDRVRIDRWRKTCGL